VDPRDVFSLTRRLRRVTDVSRIRGTRRTQEDTRGHDDERS